MLYKYVYGLFVTLAILVVTMSNVSSVGAAKPTQAAKPKTDTIGYDVSWPQCGVILPSNPSFVVVGVNGGLANNDNPCLEQQLRWAETAAGISNQPGLQLYLNTANPGTQSDGWPVNNMDPLNIETSNPYGFCDGSNSRACAWQYGYNKAFISDKSFFVDAALGAKVSTNASEYIWWLDVEQDNTWQSGSTEALASNRAVLEGMTDYLKRAGVKTVGIYSTMSQWTDITGGKDKIPANSSLNYMPDWRPSGSLQTARYNCSKAFPLTSGGRVAMTQYVALGFDRNYSCPE